MGDEGTPRYIAGLANLNPKKRALVKFLREKDLIPKIVEARKDGGMRPLDVMLTPTLQDLFVASSREMQVNGSLMLHHSSMELLSSQEVDYLVEEYELKK